MPNSKKVTTIGVTEEQAKLLKEIQIVNGFKYLKEAFDHTLDVYKSSTVTNILGEDVMEYLKSIAANVEETRELVERL